MNNVVVEASKILWTPKKGVKHCAGDILTEEKK
jgi:hypothetical protein